MSWHELLARGTDSADIYKKKERNPVTMPKKSWSVGVVIPARNEEDSVESCLDSVIAAIHFCPAVERAFVVLVADSCEDGTVDRARHRLVGQGVILESSAACPGVARRQGVDEILSHFAHEQTSRLWIANTDADSRVPTNWLERQLSLADEGYCAVAGIVSLASPEALPPEVVTEWSRDYSLYPDGTHPHVHGANLGFRADAYESVGGWSGLQVAEDHCLWSRLRGHGWPVVASTMSVVSTSGRLHGRARGGFADSLRDRMIRLSGDPQSS
jgi:cellulose synthase/poly-beta-1,6-N-acetylglucosamine synthase-like glycosyltransferase